MLALSASWGKQTDLILPDFAKAFKKVNHVKLIWKLQQYGTRSNVLNWICAFLGNRSQWVLLGVRVWIGTITSGVPQGSVLGLILFLVYINDLPEKITSQICLFADDMALYLALEGAEDSSVLQQDLDKLSVWESDWDMEFNPSKNQVLQVTGSRNPISSTYKLHGEILETVTCDTARYLDLEVHKFIDYPYLYVQSLKNDEIFVVLGSFATFLFATYTFSLPDLFATYPFAT